MPSRTRRYGRRGRPPLGDRRTLGSSGSIRSHNASGMRKSSTTVVREVAIAHLPTGESLHRQYSHDGSVLG